MNEEKHLLQIFRSLNFDIKCSDNKKDSFDFFYQEPFLLLNYV